MSFFKKIFSGDRGTKDRNAVNTRTRASPELPRESHGSHGKSSHSFDVSFGSDSLGSELASIWTNYSRNSSSITSGCQQELDFLSHVRRILTIYVEGIYSRSSNAIYPTQVVGHPQPFLDGIINCFLREWAMISGINDIGEFPVLQRSALGQSLQTLESLCHWNHNVVYIWTQHAQFRSSFQLFITKCVQLGNSSQAMLVSGSTQINKESEHQLDFLFSIYALTVRIVSYSVSTGSATYLGLTVPPDIMISPVQLEMEKPFPLRHMTWNDVETKFMFSADSSSSGNARLSFSSISSYQDILYRFHRTLAQNEPVNIAGSVEVLVRPLMSLAQLLDSLSSTLFNSISGDMPAENLLSSHFLLAQWTLCEILNAIVFSINEINSSLSAQDLSQLIICSENLLVGWSTSEMASLCIERRDQLKLLTIMECLLVKKGIMVIQIHSKIRDQAFVRSIPLDGLKPAVVSSFLTWVYRFSCATSTGIGRYFEQSVGELKDATEDEDASKSAQLTSGRNLVLDNLSIVCEYPQEFRLAKCSVDFWPWRGQKFSAEFGSYAEDVQLEEHEDVMQELRQEEFIKQRYRMCTISSEVNIRNAQTVDGVSGLQMSTKEEVNNFTRISLLQCTGGFSPFQLICSCLIDSIAHSSSVSMEKIHHRLLYFVQMALVFLDGYSDQSSSPTVAPSVSVDILSANGNENDNTSSLGSLSRKSCIPEFQLHFVRSLRAMFISRPKETIQACRSSNAWSLLLGSAFYGGGKHELNQLFNEDCFVDEKQKRSSKLTSKVWTFRSGCSLPTRWESIACFAWIFLRDDILDLFCDVSIQSYALNIEPRNHEVLRISSLMKKPTIPSTATLTGVYQCGRWLRYFIHPELKSVDRLERCKLGKIFLVDCMVVIGLHLEIIGLSRQQTLAVTNIPRENLKFLWAARSSILELLLILSTVEIFPRNIDWVTLFLERSSKSDATSMPVNSFSDSGIGVQDGGLLSTSRARLKTLESLLLDPRCRAASIRLITRLISVYAVEMTMSMDSPVPNRGPPVESATLDPSGSASYGPSNIENNLNLKMFTFDVVGRMMGVVGFTISYPQSIDSYNCALLCLRTLTWMLRAKKYLLLRNSIQYIFRNSDCMQSTLHSLVNLLKPNDIKNTVSESPERWILGSIVKQGLALLTCIMAGNEQNRMQFSKLILFEASDHLAGMTAPALTPESTESSARKKKFSQVSFDSLVAAIVETEGSLTVEVCIVLFDMLLESPCLRNRAMLLDPVVIQNGLFAGDDDRPKIRNASIIVLIVSLIPNCAIPLQQFILKSFCNLVHGRASLANLTICAQCKPHFLDLALDLFPLIPFCSLEYLVKLVQYLGKHSISVSQLKHVFRIVQGDGVTRPQYNHLVLEAVQGMISDDSAPFHAFVFEGEDSGLKLPPIINWPAKSGFSFCVWLYAESPKVNAADKIDEDDEPVLTQVTYEPYILYLRDGFGAGIALRLVPGSQGMFVPTLQLTGHNGESANISSTEEITEEEWHFIAISVSGTTDWAEWSGIRNNTSAFIFTNGVATKQAMAFPVVMQGPLMSPLIGNLPLNGEFRENRTQSSFRGQMGAIYMFSKAIWPNKLKNIQYLGPAYQYNFEPFTADYKDNFFSSKQSGVSVVSSAQEQNALAMLDGTLSQHILLSYNPAVWNGEMVLDNTPAKNGVRWHSGTLGGVFFEQNILVDEKGYYKMHARAMRGTYHTRTQDIRNALDSLGGIKTLFPFFSQFDQPLNTSVIGCAEDTSQFDTKLSYWVISLLETLLHDASARKREVRGLSVLGYLLESVSSKHLSLDSLSTLLVIFDELAWNSYAQDVFMESIFSNFRLWRNCSSLVQSRLYSWLLSMSIAQPHRFKDQLSIPKFIDALWCFFDYRKRSNSQVQVEEKGSKDDELFANINSVPDGQLTQDELKDIRFIIFEVIFNLFSKSPVIGRDDVRSFVSYIVCSPCITCQQEGLQVLLKLILQKQTSMRVLSGLGLVNGLPLIANLVSSSSSTVRMYALMVISKTLVVCANSVPLQQSGTPDSSALQKLPVMNSHVDASGKDQVWTDFDEMNSSFVVESTAPGIADSSVVGQQMDSVGTGGIVSAGSIADTRSISFEDMGIPPWSIVGMTSAIEDSLVRAIRHCASELECQIICILFQMTMFGIDTTYAEIVSAIHSLELASMIPLKFPIVNSLDGDVACRFTSKDSERSQLTFQLTSDISICIPMLFIPLLKFIGEEFVSIELRCNVLLNLRAALSMSNNNCDMILHIPSWQNYILQSLVSETARYLSLQPENTAGAATAATIERDIPMAGSKRSDIKLKSILDVCMRMICELQMTAVRIGKPVGPSIIRRKHELVAPIDVYDSLKKVSRGERHLGVLVIRETLSFLRIYGSLCNFDVQEIACGMIKEMLFALKREQELLVKKKSSGKETAADLATNFVVRILQLNVWLVASMVLDFIYFPFANDLPLVGSRSQHEGGTQHSRSVSDRAMKFTFNVTFPASSAASDDPSLAETLSSKKSKLGTAKVLELVNFLLDILRPSADSHQSMLGEDRTFLLQASSNIGLFTGSKVIARMNDNIDQVLSTQNASLQSRKGSDPIDKLASLSSFIPSQLQLKSNWSLLNKSPMSNATGGVGWVMTRVIGSILTTPGFLQSETKDLCIQPVELITKLKWWILTWDTQDIDANAFENFHVCATLFQRFRDLDVSQTATPVRAALELAVFLMTKYRNSFYEIIDRLSMLDNLSSQASGRTISLSSRAPSFTSRLGFTGRAQSDDLDDSISTGIAENSNLMPMEKPSPSRQTAAPMSQNISDSIIAECLSIFDTSVISSLPFTDTLLRILNLAINNVPGFESASNTISWDMWDRIYNCIAEQAQSMENEYFLCRLTDTGLHKHSQEILDEFDKKLAEDLKVASDWKLMSDQAVARTASQQIQQVQDKYRADDLSRRRAAGRWSTIVAELANERGPWGYSGARKDVFWMIDSRETARRQRPRLRRNPSGTRHLVASQRRAGKDVALISTASEETRSRNEDVLAPAANDIWRDMQKYKKIALPALPVSASSSDEPRGNMVADDASEGEEDDVTTAADTRSVISWDSENAILFSLNVEIITMASNSTGGRTSGLLEVSRSRITFTRSAEHDGGDSAAASVNQEYSWVRQLFPNTVWPAADIHMLFQRTYLLQFTAVEIMFTNRTSVFINLFSEKFAQKLYKCIQKQLRPPFLIVLPHRTPERAVRTAIATGSSLLLTNAWMHRQISNFEYLMHLNTIAGRTFNDLGQYPIFPWVLADYNSPRLDLTNPKTFRDFRWPVGAQTPAQRQFCGQRYKDANEMYESNPSDEFPPFHHGTHYSCMGFVFWYLVRMEPFTSLAVWLQDGKFDHPDRMFSSIPDAWNGVSSNHNDVKELIPEFFFMPEFLENLNGIDLGTAQDGTKLGAVKLPPWASTSLEFIRLHREALESEFVSANLHHWIDLIFGYKQRPPMFKGNQAAIDSFNVFFHLTYSDAVNLEEMKKNDSDLYDRTIRQIDNYGQTPSRLFDKAHPPRRPLSKVKVIWPIASVILGIDTIPAAAERPELPKRIMCFKEEKVAAFPILLIAEVRNLKRLVTIDASRMIGFHYFITKQPDVVPPFTLKVDVPALKIALGQQSGEGWFHFSSKIPREFFVGVPFAALGLTSSKSKHMFASGSSISTSLIGHDDNKRLMLRREAERGRLRSTSSVSVSSTRSESIATPGVTPLKKKVSSRDVAPRAASSSVNLSETRSSKSSPSSSSNTRSGLFRAADLTSAALGSAPSTPLQGNTASGSLPSSSSANTTESNARKRSGRIESRVYDNLSPHLFAIIPETKLLLSCGHWDNSFKVTHVDTGKLIQSVMAHSEVVTCLALASDFGNHWVVTGSRDCTVMIWDVFPDRAMPIASAPTYVLYGHDDSVSCVAVNAELDTVLSGSDDGTITIYSLREGIYIRSIFLDRFVHPVSSLTNPAADLSISLPIPPLTRPTYSDSTTSSVPTVTGVPLVSSRIAVHMVCISRESYVIVYASDASRNLLFSYSLNGKCVERIELPERLMCMCLSEDARVIITGGDRCLVVMRWVHNLQLANDGPREGQEAVLDGKEGDQGPFGSSIRSLYLTQKERHLIVGLESGDIRILAQDSEYLRKRLVSNLEDIGLIASSLGGMDEK